MLRENDVVATRYRLVRELGRGGMGVVWAAQDLERGGAVAVKVITPKLARDKKKLDRFEAGAQAVARLSSPHIVKLLEYGVDQVPFMVMELLEGEVLTERLRHGQPFELSLALRIVVQTATALTVAHEAGVVHRNLKPGNIFLVRQGDEEFVKVFDFGTAKWLTGFRNANDITTMGAIMGSPDYLAPEQLSGDARSDHRADVWSLGALAYHVLTGVTPFEGEQMGAIMRNILFTEPEPPSHRVPSLPPALDAFFLKALAKKRDERFQTALELADALCEAVGVDREVVSASGRATASRPPGLTQDDSTELELPDTRVEGAEGAPRGRPPSTELPESVTPELSSAPAAAVEVPRGTVELRVATPPHSLLVTPRRARRLDLPSAPVLVLGAVVFLALGGLGAWFVMAPRAGRPLTTPAPGSAAARGHAPEPSSSSAVRPAEHPADPGPRRAEPMPSAAAEPSAAPSAVPETEASSSASAEAPPTPPPRRWRDPNDIYDGL